MMTLSSGNTVELHMKDHGADLVVVFPGGGYAHTSEREGPPVARRLHDQGFHSAVYRYREAALKGSDLFAEGKRLLEDLAERNDVRRLFVMGFSAGGHFAGMMAASLPGVVRRAVLCYPVVTALEDVSHSPSFSNLFGHVPTEDEKRQVSLERLVHPEMGPVFLMHTEDDPVVSVRNTYLLDEALQKHDVPVTLWLRKHGPHGVSLATHDVSFEDMDADLFEREYGHLQGWFLDAVRFLRS
jgi:acetyl esterase/lipase